MIRVLIVDDHQLVIDGLELLLEKAPDIQVVGKAYNGKEGYKQVKILRPDVILLDMNMPEMNGLQTCRKVTSDFPKTRVLVLSMVSEGQFIRNMLKNGASGYLVKNADKEELLDGIRTVAQGNTYISNAIKDNLVHVLTRSDKSHRPLGIPKLTRREKEVMSLILDEQLTAEIAEQLHISIGTVETHRRNMLTKLGVRNTAGLVRVVMEFNLLDR